MNRIKYYVITHRSCNDGRTAAMIAFTALIQMKEQPYDVIFCEVQPAEVASIVRQLIAGPRTSIVRMFDVSIDRDNAVALMSHIYDCRIYDHHKTTGESVFGSMLSSPIRYYVKHEGVGSMSFLKFNVDKSGATLAWEEYYPSCDVPRVVKMIEAHDLFRFDTPEIETEALGVIHLLKYKKLKNDEFHEQLAADGIILPRGGIRFHVSSYLNISSVTAEGKLFYFLDGIQYINSESWVPSAQSVGKIVQMFKKESIAKAIRASRMRLWRGYSVVFCNAASDVADIADHLTKEGSVCDFSFSWRADMNTDRVYVSLRSAPRSKIDVEKIAKMFGGGGHANAAAFKCSMQQLLDILKDAKISPTDSHSAKIRALNRSLRVPLQV